MPDQHESDSKEKRHVSRRVFLKGLGTGVAGTTAVAATSLPILGEVAEAAQDELPLGPEALRIELDINGRIYTVKAEPRETLLEVLRNRLDITGPKLACDSGTCGACTVYLDEKPVYACMTLAIKAQGKKIKN